MASLWIAKNIISRLFREVQTYIFLIGFPILSGFIALAMVSGFSVQTVGVAGLENEEMLEYLKFSEMYEFVALEESQVNSSLEKGQIDFALSLPRGLQPALTGERPEAEVIALDNTTEVLQFTEVINGFLNGLYIGESNLDELNQDYMKAQMEKPRVGVGIMTMFIIMYIGYGVGVILEDKKAKTFMRSYSAPIKSYDMVLGNLLANLLLGVVQLLIFITFSTFVLNFQWGISIAHLFILLFVYMITVVGLSVGIMGFVSNNEVYFAISVVIATATCMLGGSFFEVSMMNSTLQKISNFFPQRWVMDAFETLYYGGGLQDIRFNLFILVLFALALFSFGIKTLKPQENDL